MIPLIAKIIFYGLLLVLGVFGATMAYVLLRFGKSKSLAMALIIFYFLLMSSLYAAAQKGFNDLPFI